MRHAKVVITTLKTILAQREQQCKNQSPTPVMRCIGLSIRQDLEKGDHRRHLRLKESPMCVGAKEKAMAETKWIN